MQAPFDTGTRLYAPVTFYIVLYFFALVKHFIIGYNRNIFRKRGGILERKEYFDQLKGKEVLVLGLGIQQ